MSMDGILVEARLLAVNAIGAGQYNIQGVGMPPRVGDSLLLPLKGALSMSLKLPVVNQFDMISPDHAWQALCDGPILSVFNIRNMELECDDCHIKANFEFVEFGDDVASDAMQSMSKLGWQAGVDRQICPACKQSQAEPTGD